MKKSTDIKMNILPFLAIGGILLIILGVMVPYSMYAAAAYTAIVLLVVKPRDCVMLLFCWLHFATIFKLPGIAISVFTVLEILVILKLFLVKRRINTRFLIVWAMISVYLLIGMGSEVTVWLKIILSPLLFYFMATEIERDSLKPATYYYTMGLFISSAVGLFKAYIPNMDEAIGFKVFYYQSLGEGNWISRIRFSGLWNDPNYYSIHALLVISLFVVLFAKRKIHALPFAIVSVSAVLLGALTCSKAYLLVLCILAVFSIFILLNNRRYGAAAITILLIIVFASLVLLGKIEAFSSMLERLSITDISSLNGISTDRFDKIVCYLQEFYNEPLKLIFGNGLFTGFSFDIPHNTVIDYLDIFGIFGTFLFVLCLMRATRFGFGNTIRNRGSILPLIVILIMYMSLSMIYAIDLIFEVFLAVGYCILPVSSLHLPDDSQKKELKQ